MRGGDMSSDIQNPLETLQLIEQKCMPATLKRIAEECHSFCMVLDGYHFSEGSCSLDTLQRIEGDWGSFLVFSDKYLSKLSHLRETLKQTEDECSSFHIFPDACHLEYIFWQTKKECDSLLKFSKKYLSSDESLPIETLQRVKDECDSFKVDPFAVEEFELLERDIKFLKRDLKLLEIILNLQTFTGETDLIRKLQALFQDAAADLIQIYRRLQTCRREGIHPFYVFSGLPIDFWHTKLNIRKAEYSFFKVSFQLLANKDGIVTPNSVMEFIDTVIENLSDLLKLDDPSSPLHVGGLVDQVEKVLKELKFLFNFVCFVSDRCVEPEVQHTFFTHVLEVAWHTTVVTWLYLPSHKDSCLQRKKQRDRDSAADKGYPLFSDLLRNKIQPIEPSISKIYIDVLKAIKLQQSQWYPAIQIKYVVDCEVGFVETLLHNLEELPLILSGIEITEMLNFLRAHLLTQALAFHLQDIDSVIVDAGILVYSLNEKEKGDLDFRAKIQNLQAMIYLIIRKTFLLKSNLPGIDRVGSGDFILDSMEKFLSLYSNSVDSVKSQLQTIQKELKRFRADVEKQDGLQHFVTHTNSLVYEVEYVFDACKKKDVPDWCLFLWILNIGKDMRMLMAEVAEVQENTVAEVSKKSMYATTHTSSRFASNPSTNEEMVGFKDVMNELRDKLTKGSVNLDVVSIVGMAGLGKTTLANELYFDESVVSYFDIRAHCCVSQEYKRKDLLLDLLRVRILP